MAENDEGYRIIDHTADIGLEATGNTLEEAFENAAKGMFAILSDNSEIIPKKEEVVSVEGDDLEGLLVEFLSRLLFLYEVEGMLFSEFSIRIDEQRGQFLIEGTAKGEPYDPERHSYPLEIKAVTYHMLEVVSDPPFVRVIFDL